MNTNAIVRKARSAGFTLIELMFVVVLVAILGALALPAFQEMIAAQRVRAASSALYDSLTLARSEAIKRNTAVTMTVTNLRNGWTIVAGTTTLRSQESFGNLNFSPVAPTIAYNRYGRLSSGSGQKIQVTANGSSKTRCITIDATGRPNVTQGVCP